MLAIKIDNPDIENRFKQYAKQQKKTIEDVINDAIKLFIDTHTKNDEIFYVKRDPMEYLEKIEYTYNEELCDDVALTHIKDSAKYIHNIRRKIIYD
jgi:hypothetical protein